MIYLTGIRICVNECAGKLYLILFAAELDLLGGDGNSLVGLGVRCRDRFTVDLLDGGAPREFPALQQDIGGDGIRFHAG